MRHFIAVTCLLLLPVMLSAQGGPGVTIHEIDLAQFPTVQLKLRIVKPLGGSVDVSTQNAQLNENGIPQRVDYFECPKDSSVRLSIAILLDRSASMARDANNEEDPDSLKMRAAKAAIGAFLDRIDTRDEAAIFSFTTVGFFLNHVFTVEHDFSSDPAALKGSLVPIVARGGTRMWDAVIDAVDLLKLRAGRKVLILVTDGNDRSFFNSRDIAIRSAVDEGIPVYTIGIGEDVDEGALSGLASATGGRFFSSPTPSTLNTIFTQLGAELLSDDCVLRYVSSNPCLDGSRRDIELTLTGLGFAAEADTFYTVERSLTPATISVGHGRSVVASDTVVLPVNILEQFSTSQPLTFSMTVTYDASLMRFLDVNVQGTMFAGRLIDVQETVPGTLRISLQNQLPLFPSGTLFELLFASYSRSEEVQTRVDIGDGEVITLCPMDVRTEGGELRIEACEERFSLSTGSFVAGDGSTVEIPVVLRPGMRPGADYTFRMTLAEPPSGLQFEDIVTAGTLAESSDMLVQPVPNGGLGITMTVTGEEEADSTLFILRYRASAGPDVQKIPLDLLLGGIESGCGVTASVEQPLILVDGICRPLLRRKAAALTVSNYPNPFTDRTVLTYAIPAEGPVRLHLMDTQGRRIRTLLDASLPAGTYEHRLDAAQLTPGDYMVVLRAGDREVIRRILCVR
jgi:hypothetical protein